MDMADTSITVIIHVANAVWQNILCFSIMHDFCISHQFFQLLLKALRGSMSSRKYRLRFMQQYSQSPTSAEIA